MLRAIMKSKEGEKDLLFIGLSEGNVKNLKIGKPIVFDMPELSHQVCIHYGQTEGDIAEEMAEIVGKEKMPSSYRQNF